MFTTLRAEQISREASEARTDRDPMATPEDRPFTEPDVIALFEEVDAILNAAATRLRWRHVRPACRCTILPTARFHQLKRKPHSEWNIPAYLVRADQRSPPIDRRR